MKSINFFLCTDFVFSSRYRTVRHLIYWSFQVITWAFFWTIMGSPSSFERNVFSMGLWLPVFTLFSYPLAYVAIPRLLLNEKVWQFCLVLFVWGIAWLSISSGFRTYVYAPLQEALDINVPLSEGHQPQMYLCMATSAASPMIVRLYKLWTLKQRDWMRAQQEKITTELQLLKAQVHPYFLFNTLNNIYSFSLAGSAKTPQLILKLSSLLSYMLYDCRSDEALLQKEIGIIRHYLDLEEERYGSAIEISWLVEGDVRDKVVSPLIWLPFLENAFKYTTAEPSGKPWLSVELSVTKAVMHLKIVNSKRPQNPVCGHPPEIQNAAKRLHLLYPQSHSLKMTDNEDFFSVLLALHLDKKPLPNAPPVPDHSTSLQKATV